MFAIIFRCTTNPPTSVSFPSKKHAGFVAPPSGHGEPGAYLRHRRSWRSKTHAKPRHCRARLACDGNGKNEVLSRPKICSSPLAAFSFSQPTHSRIPPRARLRHTQAHVPALKNTSRWATLSVLSSSARSGCSDGNRKPRKSRSGRARCSWLLRGRRRRLRLSRKTRGSRILRTRNDTTAGKALRFPLTRKRWRSLRKRGRTTLRARSGASRPRRCCKRRKAW